MNSYLLIAGDSQDIPAFETKVADALDMGYELASELISHATDGKIHFFQAVMIPDDEEDLDDLEDDVDQD